MVIHLKDNKFDLRPLHMQRERFQLKSFGYHPFSFSGPLLGLSASSLGLSALVAYVVGRLYDRSVGQLAPAVLVCFLLLLGGLVLTSRTHPGRSGMMYMGFVSLTVGASAFLQLLLLSITPLDMTRVYIMVLPSVVLYGLIAYFIHMDGALASAAGFTAVAFGICFAWTGWFGFEVWSKPVATGESFIALISAMWMVYLYCRCMELDPSPQNATAAAVAMYREPVAYLLVMPFMMAEETAA